jgi:hypothetical protein
VPGSQIAAALRTSPLYVDPSLSSAFPAAARKALLAAIRKAPTPIYIVAVPMVNGGQWADSRQLADVVQADLGSPGIYLTMEDSSDNVLDAWTWPSDPSGIDAPPYHAVDAVEAAGLEEASAATSLQSPPVWQAFLTAIQLIDSGKAVSALNQAQAALESGAGQPAAPSPGSNAAAGGVTLALATAGAVVGTAFGVRRRRRRRRTAARHALGETAAAFTPPRSVAAAARAATEAGLRDRAQRELIALGNLIEQPGPATEEGNADLARAIDAYDAAGRTLDTAAGLTDLAGALVLTHMGSCAAWAAQARQAGRPVPAATMLCFFNPLHGEGLEQVRWREMNGQSLEVRACGACAGAVTQRRHPDVLTGTSRRRGVPVPWYEDGDSVWAATGYGQFGPDVLLRRILER